VLCFHFSYSLTHSLSRMCRVCIFLFVTHCNASYYVNAYVVILITLWNLKKCGISVFLFLKVSCKIIHSFKALECIVLYLRHSYICEDYCFIYFNTFFWRALNFISFFLLRVDITVMTGHHDDVNGDLFDKTKN
jgi:hypothetical protein